MNHFAALSLRVAFATLLALGGVGCVTAETSESDDEDQSEEMIDQDSAALERRGSELCDICDALRETPVEVGVPNHPGPAKAAAVKGAVAGK